MNWLRQIALRLRAAMGKTHRERMLDEELQTHLALLVDQNIARGMSPEEARRAAKLSLGGADQIKESVRDHRGLPLLDTFAQDVRFAFRMLRKSPGFTAVAVLTLALGIGANVSIFSVVYAALLRPLPYSQPSRLMTLDEAPPFWNASYPDYLDWKSQTKMFQSLAAFSGDGFILRGGGEPQLLPAAEVTTNFFSTLGVEPMLGRDFAAGEDIAAGPKVAILTYNFWRTQFGADPQVIGRTMQLGDRSASIIGVLPRQFEFAPAGNAAIWVPMHISGELLTRRNLRWIPVIGRLAAGVTPANACSEITVINSRLAAQYPEANRTTQVLMTPLRERIIGQIEPLLLILFGAVGFVLLIACANVANLLMVRSAGRRRELAIRAALGASRRRLLLQLLTESLMLAVAGGALGFGGAQWGTQALIAVIPAPLLDSMPFLRDTRASIAAFAFLCGVAVLTGVLFGLAPALEISHGRPGDILKEGAQSSAGGVRTRLRNVLVVAEIALSLVLLAGAGLMVESLSALVHRDPGFDTQDLMTFDVNLPAASYPKDPDAMSFDKQFRDRVRSLPGIAGIANTSVVPLTGGGNTLRFTIEGGPASPTHVNECKFRDVSNEYFSVMKIPLISGRFFTDAADSATGPKRLVVNQAWVNEFFHGKSPLGTRIKFGATANQPYRDIVGVVGSIADGQLDGPEEPALYLPFSQDVNSYISYMVRTSSNPASTLGEIRTALRGIDPLLFLIQPLTMEQIISRSPSVFLRRYPSYLFGIFAGLALVLAMVGLYGLISYSVSQRTREMGIRVALGAQERDVLRLVIGQGARLALIGVAIGIAAALALTRLMASLLYGVSASDPLAFAVAAVLVTLVALVACYAPARRAVKVDPVVALRYE